MMTNSKNPVQELTQKICSECGRTMDEKNENYLMECDYCLSKKSE
nr:protein YhfH [uncultured Bacillus sp.]